MDAELAPHPHRMSLWGTPAGARYPPLCPNCGKAAVRSLPLTKSFTRASGSDTPNETVLLSAAVPFCEPCIARHEEQAGRPGVLAALLPGVARATTQTEVSRAFDFSDNEPAPFRAPMYTCTMRDAGFFAAFREVNREHEFVPGSPAELADRRQANRQTWVVGAIVAAIALFFMLRDLFG